MWHATSDYPAARRQAPVEHTVLAWLQVDTASATTLRQAVIRAGVDAVRFLRIDPCPNGGPNCGPNCGPIRALLCVEKDAAPPPARAAPATPARLPVARSHPARSASPCALSLSGARRQATSMPCCRSKGRVSPATGSIVAAFAT